MKELKIFFSKNFFVKMAENLVSIFATEKDKYSHSAILKR